LEGTSEDTEGRPASEGTHNLESAWGGRSEHVDRKEVREGHSQTRECIRRDKWGYEKKAGEKRALTFWITYQGEVRQQKNTSKGHSLPEECMWWGKARTWKRRE
jgi:hypothetical protein